MSEIEGVTLAIPSCFPSSDAYVCRCLQSGFKHCAAPFGGLLPASEWVAGSLPDTCAVFLLAVPLAAGAVRAWRSAGFFEVFRFPNDPRGGAPDTYGMTRFPFRFPRPPGITSRFIMSNPTPASGLRKGGDVPSIPPVLPPYGMPEEWKNVAACQMHHKCVLAGGR